MKLTETEKAYIAGIVDGEGALLVNKREHAANPTACTFTKSI